jgi:hypothetical protein
VCVPNLSFMRETLAGWNVWTVTFFDIMRVLSVLGR